MLRGRNRVATVAATVVAAAMIGPAGAAAAPSQVSLVIDQGDPNDMPPHGVLRLEAGPHDPTPRQIIVTSVEDGAYLLRDSAGIQIAPAWPDTEHDAQCSELHPYLVRCAPTTAEPLGELDVRGGGGRDWIDVRVTRSSVRNLVDGRRGPDRILGSDGEEIALGGGGNDVLIGYGGRDLLNGGGGADTIRSRDGLRDQISCGRGDGRREKAIRDRWDTKITIVVGGAWEHTEPISC